MRSAVTVGAAAACTVVASARLLPDAFDPERGHLPIWFATVALIALGTGVIIRSSSGQRTVTGTATSAAIGALLIDGLAVGFAPSLYGQDVASLNGFAALLLWGVGALLVGANIADLRHSGQRVSNWSSAGAKRRAAGA